MLGEHAKKWKVCPFEMALDLSVWVDAVICDYNYVFDPNVTSETLFRRRCLRRILFLIDEAHNLVERGRTMYSTSISRQRLVTLAEKR